MKRRTIPIILAAVAVAAAVSLPGRAEQPVRLKYARAELEAKWEARIRAVLAAGMVPLIDLESSLRRDDGDNYIDDALKAMDKAGVALIAFDGYQAPKTPAIPQGYRWGYYIHEVVNAHPDRFILATNGGTNPNWTKGKDSFIAQTEAEVRRGDYPIMGEFEFRHYMSSQQCKDDRTDRDVDVPIDGPNGQRLFKLSEQTGVAFVIHNEPEDAPLEGLEKMLKAYPKANVINAHFGQLRHPEKQRRFTPELVRRLLSTYPNLYFDLSTGEPGRGYPCGTSFDTVIWQRDGGWQKSELVPAYKAILSEFSRRFVVGLDYGGGRRPLPQFIDDRAANIRLILRDLPDGAKHDIGYRNAWKLLTGKDWK